ncbi:MAG: hypothetical protein HYU39_05760 [Thaumarchaeota archaeon]|nr:hypothetical protein [Nitrososphaerota archaeon]
MSTGEHFTPKHRQILLLLTIAVFITLPKAYGQTLELSLDRNAYLPGSNGEITITLREAPSQRISQANATLEIIYYNTEGRINVDRYSSNSTQAKLGDPVVFRIRLIISSSASPGYANINSQVSYATTGQLKILSGEPKQLYIESPYRKTAEQLAQELSALKSTIASSNNSIKQLSDNIKKLTEENQKLTQSNNEQAKKTSDLVLTTTKLQDEIRSLNDKLRAEQRKSSSLEQQLALLGIQNYFVGREIINYVTIGTVIIAAGLVFVWLIRSKRLIIEIQKDTKSHDEDNAT